MLRGYFTLFLVDTIPSTTKYTLYPPTPLQIAHTFFPSHPDLSLSSTRAPRARSKAGEALLCNYQRKSEQQPEGAAAAVKLFALFDSVKAVASKHPISTPQSALPLHSRRQAVTSSAIFSSSLPASSKQQRCSTQEALVRRVVERCSPQAAAGALAGQAHPRHRRTPPFYRPSPSSSPLQSHSSTFPPPSLLSPLLRMLHSLYMSRLRGKSCLVHGCRQSECFPFSQSSLFTLLPSLCDASSTSPSCIASIQRSTSCFPPVSP